jgi:RNA polymerase sigma factor (sigma-70 family)
MGLVGGPMTTGTVELVRAACGGDPDAWAAIIARYERLLRSRARAFGLQEADAADVVQATWLRLYENLGSIRDPERLPGWLNRTAGRECLRLLAHRQRTCGPVDPEAVMDPVAGPEERILEAERAERMRAGVATLAGASQAVIRSLFAEEPASYAEVAEDTGLAPGSVGPIRGRALSQLRRWMDRGDREVAV